MIRPLLTIWLCLAACTLAAQVSPKQELTRLFQQAERCYMLDDYQQLLACCRDYRKVMAGSYDELEDSVDVFSGYEYKMLGALYYGLTDKDNLASIYSEEYYQYSLDVFKARHDDNKVNTLHRELAQLYYKMGQ